MRRLQVRFSARGWLGFVWGIGGVLALLIGAVVRLVPVALEALRMGLGVWEGLALVSSLALLGYFEGYMAFQRGFSPRVVARALALARRPGPPLSLRMLAAPAFTMQLFGAVRRRLIVAWGVTFGVFGLILWVSSLAQPWRGIVDAGVVFALSWGSGAIVYFAVQALLGRPLPVDDDIPASKR